MKIAPFSSQDLLSRLVEPRADRLELVTGSLRQLGVPHEILTAGDTRHVWVHPGRRVLPGRRIKTIVAHHDRYPDSPGANDNAAAVARLVELSASPVYRKAQNLQILFTDREEVVAGDRLREQGAWKLATWLKGQPDAKRWCFFSFDVFGCGDTPVLSTTGGLLLKKRLHGAGFDRWKTLFHATLRRMARFSTMEPLATPLSDDWSFTAHGFPSVLLTALPMAEIRGWRKRREYPKTWQRINSIDDTPETLTPASEGLLHRVFQAIAGMELTLRDLPA
ncbi:MAG: M28 family peptidase [Spirochaetes bacterium]|nr:M28 family peptidase [Spirochaetota bacterium]